MASDKPTIVLISGGWHVPATYAKLTIALRAVGYEVHVPRLPSLNGSRPPNADLATDTALVRSYVESLVEAGRTVIALMHSYGGQVGTNALHGLGRETRAKANPPQGGGVAHLVYMCAFALPEGGSLIGKVRDFGHEDLMPLVYDYADDRTVWHRDPKLMVTGDGASDAEKDDYLGSFVLWNGACMDQESSHCAWRDIPVTYIHGTEDMVTPPDYQKSMIEGMRQQGREVDVVELATGHCPNLTATAAVVDVIDRVAGQVNRT